MSKQPTAARLNLVIKTARLGNITEAVKILRGDKAKKRPTKRAA
jgi:hypothetical protein